MLDDERATEAHQRFADALRKAWLKAAPRSYSDFERLSETVLGKKEALRASTTQEIVTGRRRHPPKWEWVVKYLKVLEVAARNNGVDPDRLGALEVWKARHEAAHAPRSGPRRLAGVSNGAGGLADLGDVPASSGVPSQRGPFPSAGGGRDDAAMTAIQCSVGVEWWQQDYAQVVPSWFEGYLSLEPSAALIRTYDNTLVPALLQTAEYAQAALQLDVDVVSEVAVAQHVDLRMRRQRILDRPTATRLWALVDERALRRRLGSPAIMRRQLLHLVHVTGWSNVTVQVIPARSRVYSALAYPLTLLRFSSHELPDVAYVELLTSGLYLHDLAQVNRYMQVMEGLSLQGLGPEESVAFIKEILREM